MNPNNYFRFEFQVLFIFKLMKLFLIPIFSLLSIFLIVSCRKDPQLNNQVLTKSSKEIKTLDSIYSPTLIDTSNQYFLKISVTNFKSIDGNINIALFDDEASFDNKSTYYIAKSYAVNNDTMDIILTNLHPHTYALSLYHDQNKNNELDQNILGIPQEGFAFSNNAMGAFGPPSFNMAKFEIKKNVNSYQKISLKYF